MTARPAGQLYTPEMLHLATQLADFPLRPELPLHGEARSATCGSKLALDLEIANDEISASGLLVQACAVGQASAALFAQWIDRRRISEVTDAGEAVERWLTGDGRLPECFDLAPIAARATIPAGMGRSCYRGAFPTRFATRTVRANPSGDAPGGG